MKIELKNAQDGHFASINYSEIAAMYQYSVYSGRRGYMGFRAEIPTKTTDRGYTKTLRGAKAAVSQKLGYKAEWSKV
ncbi:hypothetical protein MKY96_32525 [Paenibacillus sp. FSL R7-0302]|uniref:hypothetical protein n=1 Tax=Paenibacillus sp. FSL R7-0302 TaxID=2921681 RepID=UPI0030F9534F